MKYSPKFHTLNDNAMKYLNMERKVLDKLLQNRYIGRWVFIQESTRVPCSRDVMDFRLLLHTTEIIILVILMKLGRKF